LPPQVTHVSKQSISSEEQIVFCTRGISSSLAIAVSLLIGIAALAHAATLPIRVMTYNTNNGTQADGQLDTIAAQNPDLVVLQEASYTQLVYYVAGLNARLGTSAWHGAYARHCKAGSEPTCTTVYDGSIMILTRLSTLATDSILVWAADDYVVARAALHMEVGLADGTPVNIFVCHLPAVVGGSFSGAETARGKYFGLFQAWAETFGGQQLVGGDFNTHPDSTTFASMSAKFADAWTTAEGSGGGFTHTNPDVTTRLDYWWNKLGGSLTLSSVSVVPDSVHSDHRPVVATYYAPSSTGPRTLLSDTFSSLDRSKWPGGVFTGSTDSTIPVAVTSGALTIGPLHAPDANPHYNGISTAAYDLSTGGAAYVQLTNPPNTSTAAYAMFAMGSDENDFYRWYESGNALVAQKKIDGVKTSLVDVPYDATADQFLRIRRQYNSSTGTYEVIFETAANNSGAPGTFTVRYQETWDSHVAQSSLKVELKAGTSTAIVSPGSATWDNVLITSF
jgi:endonuclease/exonuclease/phosphatase family metal-dependent hydrolase